MPDVFPMLDNIKLKNSHIHTHFSIYCFTISYNCKMWLSIPEKPQLFESWSFINFYFLRPVHISWTAGKKNLLVCSSCCLNFSAATPTCAFPSLCAFLLTCFMLQRLCETLRGVIFDRGIYGHFPIYRMFTFWICVEHLLYSLVVSCLKLDHKHFEAGTMSSCILLVYLGPTVMEVQVTAGDCNNKNNTTRNNFAFIK